MAKLKTKSKPQREPETAQAPTLGEYKVIPRDRIWPDPDQPRKDFEEGPMEDLAWSISQNGIAVPLTVQLMPGLKIKEPDMIQQDWQAMDAKGAVVFSGSEAAVKEFAEGKTEDFYQIIFGERRWRASEARVFEPKPERNDAKVRWAGMAELPAVVREVTDQDRFVLQWIENNYRVNLNELEEAEALKLRIEQRKQSDATFNALKMADELGIANGTVYNRIKLTRLYEPVRHALKSGKIEISAALAIAKIPDPGDQEELLGRVTDERSPEFPFSVRKVEQIIDSEYMAQLRDAPFDLKKEYIAEFTDGDGTTQPCPFRCITCAMRSGNMKEQFPEITMPNVCTQPRCFAAKRDAHFRDLAESKRLEGFEVIDETEANRRHDLVSPDEFEFVEGEDREWKKLVGKHAPKPVLVQHKSGFDEYYKRAEAEAAAEKNGFSFKPPVVQLAPPQEDKAVESEESTPVPAAATTEDPAGHDWEKTDLVSGFKTNYRCTKCGAKGVRMGFDWPPRTKAKRCTQDEAAESTGAPRPAEHGVYSGPSEAERKEHEEAKQRLHEQEKERQRKAEQMLTARRAVAASVLPELQKRMEARPVNAKSETEFWRFMFAQSEFRVAMLFYNSPADTFIRRGFGDKAGYREKVFEKLSYQEIRSFLVEHVIREEGKDIVRSTGEYTEEFVAACKFVGIDLKKKEREFSPPPAAKQPELAGMSTKAKGKSKTKTKGKKKGGKK